LQKKLITLDLSAERKRELATILTNGEDYLVKRVFEVLGLPRRTYYHEATRVDEGELKEAIEAIVREFPTYGTRRVTKQLRRAPYGMVVNWKRVQPMMREMGLKQPMKRRPCRTTDSEHSYPRYPNLVDGLVVTYPDQVWVSDITYIRLGSGLIYLALIMDVYTRVIRGWNLSRWLDQQLTLTALKWALTNRVPTIYHSDQGMQYAASDYIDLLEGCHVQISMASQGSPEQNGYAERLICTTKEEEVGLSEEYSDFAAAYAQIGHLIEEVYQRKHIHSALEYITPVEFEAAWGMLSVSSWQERPKCVQVYESTRDTYWLALSNTGQLRRCVKAKCFENGIGRRYIPQRMKRSLESVRKKIVRLDSY